MTSTLRHLALAGFVVAGAIAAQAQQPGHTVAPATLTAEAAAPSLWPEAPEPLPASAAFVRPSPVRQPGRSLGAKALSLFAWPGYGIAAGSGGEDRQGLKAMLIVERGSAVLDGASTYAMLDTPFLPNAIHATEADPLMTRFGNRNKLGVLGSGSFLEVLINRGSVAIPDIFERKLGPHAGHVARIVTILGDGTLSMVHIQLAIFNLRNTAILKQSINAARHN